MHQEYSAKCAAIHKGTLKTLNVRLLSISRITGTYILLISRSPTAEQLQEAGLN